mmetsp:Transcript_9897/g.21053  ORF Transcript_9897/g.21053 Transcript_9897/m.21053 type:complete len:238 (-) Transcript_9897:44-757(-)
MLSEISRRDDELAVTRETVRALKEAHVAVTTSRDAPKQHPILPEPSHAPPPQAPLLAHLTTVRGGSGMAVAADTAPGQQWTLPARGVVGEGMRQREQLMAAHDSLTSLLSRTTHSHVPPRTHPVSVDARHAATLLPQHRPLFTTANNHNNHNHHNHVSDARLELLSLRAAAASELEAIGGGGWSAFATHTQRGEGGGGGGGTEQRREGEHGGNLEEALRSYVRQLDANLSQAHRQHT